VEGGREGGRIEGWNTWWKEGVRVEGWKEGRKVEGWKEGGRVEGWKGGRVEGGSPEMQSVLTHYPHLRCSPSILTILT
jgi:hypothetical protein